MRRYPGIICWKSEILRTVWKEDRTLKRNKFIRRTLISYRRNSCASLKRTAIHEKQPRIEKPCRDTLRILCIEDTPSQKETTQIFMMMHVTHSSPADRVIAPPKKEMLVSRKNIGQKPPVDFTDLWTKDTPLKKKYFHPAHTHIPLKKKCGYLIGVMPKVA